MDESKPTDARSGGGIDVGSGPHDAHDPASETQKTSGKTVESADFAIARLPLTDPLAQTVDLKTDDSLAGISVNAETANEPPLPESFGRYRVDAVLGRGGFGAVYRAWDDQLQRPVAIKVTYREQLAPALREMFLTEARSVAALDHPSIVPVYDIGQTDSGDYFVVSKLIDGSDLAARLQTDRFTHEQAVDIIRSVALALHHAHGRGLVHRDVKPGNILIDVKGNAFLTDFGLALSENQLGRGAPLVGTLLYMSPEQARREGNRVDGRSDVYSLGVVLYQLLTDRTPFRSPEALELLDLIATTDVRPPRQIDDTIPPQVEQVCLKALSRNPAERYSTAKDFADALAESLNPLPPPVKRDRRVVLAAALTAIAAIGLILLAMFRSGSAPDTLATLSATDPAAAVAVGGTLPADLRVERFEMQVSRNRGPFVPIDQAVPLRTGDHVRFSVDLNRAAYAALVWIDGQGAIDEIFPSDPEAGHRGSEPIRRLDSPQQLDRGWPVVGPGGIETAVLVVSDEPLPQDLSSMMPFSAGLPRRQVPLARYEASKQLAAISTIDALAVTSGTRALGHETTRVDDPVLNLLEELRKHYDIIHALSIRHDGGSIQDVARGVEPALHVQLQQILVDLSVNRSSRSLTVSRVELLIKNMEDAKAEMASDDAARLVQVIHAQREKTLELQQLLARIDTDAFVSSFDSFNRLLDLINGKLLIYEKLEHALKREKVDVNVLKSEASRLRSNTSELSSLVEFELLPMVRAQAANTP